MLKKVNLNSYKIVDLQNFMSMLNQSEQMGVTDIRYVRQALQQQLKERLGRIQKGTRRNEKKLKNADTQSCPSCGHSVGRKTVDKIKIIFCQSCRWSNIEKKL